MCPCTLLLGSYGYHRCTQRRLFSPWFLFALRCCTAFVTRYEYCAVMCGLRKSSRTQCTQWLLAALNACQNKSVRRIQIRQRVKWQITFARARRRRMRKHKLADDPTICIGGGKMAKACGGDRWKEEHRHDMDIERFERGNISTRM